MNDWVPKCIGYKKVDPRERKFFLPFGRVWLPQSTGWKGEDPEWES